MRQIVRVGGYVEPLRSLVLGLKYAGQRRNAEVMGELLANMLRSCAWGGAIDAIVPVPMHWKRRLQRPCDHAQMLAREVRRRLRVPIVAAVRRVRYARSQTELMVRAQRFENVAGCFAPAWLAMRVHARQKADRETEAAPRLLQGKVFAPARLVSEFVMRPYSVSGKTICIVDNLMTSGATIQEVAKAARRAGARAVYAAIVARSDPERDEHNE